MIFLKIDCAPSELSTFALTSNCLISAQQIISLVYSLVNVNVSLSLVISITDDQQKVSKLQFHKESNFQSLRGSRHFSAKIRISRIKS